MSEKFYTVGLRKRINGDRFFQHSDFMFEEVRINTHGRYWLADPFLFEKDGLVYLFYEAFDLIIRRGYIGYSIIHNDGTATDPKMVIKRKFHHSFPFIFERDNEIYIMPESCSEFNVQLFKAVIFPDEWVQDRVLAKDIYACDTILFQENGKEYLLSSDQYMNPPEGKVTSCWVRNRLFKADSLAEIKPDIMNSIVVSEGEEGIRNAGEMFHFEGKMIRPGQNCKNGQYGKGLKFFEVESVEPYIEKLIYEIDCDAMQPHVIFNDKMCNLVGTHTYNASEHYEAIDLSYYDELDIGVKCKRAGYGFLRKGYHGLKNIKKISGKIVNRIKRKTVQDKDVYQSIIDDKAPWVFISYIADSFYHRNDEGFLNAHQNKREALVMAEVFNKLGYNAYFMLYTSNKSLPDIDCKLVFGHEPGVQRAKEKYKNAKMVFYAVSTYYEYRNTKIKQMTDDFNKKYNASVPYRRLVNPHTAFLESDASLLIGSEITKNTYPEEYRDKITKIHQSTQQCKYLHNVDATGSKEIFYLASSGNILKGIQAVIEFFSNHQEYTLHWIGPVEDDVKNALQNVITPNIISYGFQDISSQMVLGLMERCDFMIYPSGVEGVPGSVLNAMKSGLIPLVTPWASFDGIEDYGFVMEDANVEGVAAAMGWAMSLSLEEIDRRKKACQKFVLENYNLDRFTKEFEEFMRGVLCI